MFRNRTDAGRQLASQLRYLRGENVLVVGLPRGGVPVAHEVARILGAPLDVILVRKLGLPFQPEVAMGALGENGVRVVDSETVERAGVTSDELEAIESRERVELDRRASLYRRGRERQSLNGRVVVIVDDGIATGCTAAAACEVARSEGASLVILAVPVVPSDMTGRMAAVADELVALSNPNVFLGVGQFYQEFGQTSDEEVIAHLDAASQEAKAAVGAMLPRAGE